MSQPPVSASTLKHTPPSSLEQPSPSKRQRLENSQTGTGDVEMRDVADSSSSLQRLPLPVLLLAVAHLLHAQAVALHPTLSRRPTSANSIARYAHAWTQYARLSGCAIACLRTVIDLTSSGSGQSGGGRLELRARCMLAECLVRMTQGQKSTVEAERVLSAGIAASDKHDSLRPYTAYFTLLSSSVSLASPNAASSVRFTRTTLRRLLSPPSRLSPAWTYHVQLALASLPGASYAEALSCWREIQNLAAQRGDDAMEAVAYIGIARLALGRGEWRVVKDALDSVKAKLQASQASEETEPISADPHMAAMPPPPPSSPSLVPPSLMIQLLLIEALYEAHMGNVKASKENLKQAHQLLDAPETTDELGVGDRDGWARIKIKPLAPTNSSNFGPDTHAPAPAGRSAGPLPLLPSDGAVVLRIPSKSLVYTFAFLASVAIHRDPFGSRPRATLFATEGLKLLDAKLAGSDYLPPSTTPSEIPATLVHLARMKIHMLIFSAELAIMRSAFDQAHAQLNDAIATARRYSSPGTNNLWLSFRSRITLAMGLLFQARGDESRAEDCFETVLMDDEDWTSDNSVTSVKKGKKRASVGGPAGANSSDTSGAGARAMTCLLAKLSLLILKIGQGMRVRLSTSSASSSSTPLSELDARFTALSQSLVAACTPTSSSAQVPPSLQLVSNFVQALTKGEITKAKVHLSQALNLANSTSSNHAKCLMLALLANLFLWTRNDQAQKMLNAAFHISRGMGARRDNRTAEAKAAAPGSEQGDEVVGAARVGLWVGERLLESYKRDHPSKVAKQEALNAAHRRVLARESALQVGV